MTQTASPSTIPTQDPPKSNDPWLANEMKKRGFSKIAARYEKGALLQGSAADTLLSLVAICPRDDVLDVGCGTGQLAAKIRALTTGRIVGIDPAEGMIHEARSRYGDLGIQFEVGTAEGLAYHDRFDVVLSNSSFQWFADHHLAVANWRRALRAGGRAAIQAPATQSFSPTFLRAMDAVATHPRSGPIFRRFRNPCLLLETPEGYASYFERAGFEVALARLEATVSRHTPQELFRVFGSGAGVAYLDPGTYDVPFYDGYVEDASRLIRQAFESWADAQGTVELLFHRVYVLAIRP